MTDLVVLDTVSRWYGNVLGLSRVTLSFRSGVTALLGPNGAGKSTLLRLICGLLKPSSGNLRVFGEPAFANPAVFRRLGMVPEEEEFRARVTGEAWLRHLLTLSGLNEAEASDRARETLEEVGLSEASGRPVPGYSRGMKQRLRIAQAIAHRPDIIVLDEPLTGLDPVGRREVISWIRKWGDEGRSVIVSSHILHEVELMTKEVVLLSAGRVMASGNVHEIRELLDRYPHRIRVTTPAPRQLAARLLEVPGLVSISFSEEDREVQLETREPERFFHRLAEMAAEQKLEISELSSPDDNLESVFHYLTQR